MVYLSAEERLRERKEYENLIQPKNKYGQSALDEYKEYNEWRYFGHNDYLQNIGWGMLGNKKGDRVFDPISGKELDPITWKVLDKRIPTANNQLEQKYKGVYRPDPVEQTDKEKFMETANNAFEGAILSSFTGGNPIYSVYKTFATPYITEQSRKFDLFGLWNVYDKITGNSPEEFVSTEHFKKYEFINPQLYVYNELETDVNSDNFGRPIVSFNPREDNKFMTFNVEVGITGQRTPLSPDDPRYIAGYDNYANVINQEEADNHLQKLVE